MHSHNRKLEELRQLVEHLEEQVKSFGALLDSVDDARFAEQDILVRGAYFCTNVAMGHEATMPCLFLASCWLTFVDKFISL